MHPAPTPVADEIARLINDVPGWTPPDQLLALHLLVMTTAPLGGDVLEIGSWCGRSTAVLGHAVARSGGHVWSVDLFPARGDWRKNADGTHSMHIAGSDGFGAYRDQTVWDEPFQRDIAPLYERADSILDIFNETMEREGLRSLVTPFRGDGRRFGESRRTPLAVRMAFIDGDHDYDAVCRDIALVERFLLPGGWIAFDDAFSHYPGVDRAITEQVVLSGGYSCAHQLSRKLFVARRDAAPTG